ncbi:unnamed protein product [Schistosoma turkestanicum]|nr:unnamed protein product [Schistosoma turkestanicum]
MILPWLPSLLEAYESEKDWFYILCKRYVHVLSFALGFEEGSTWDTVLIGGLLSSLSSLAQFASSPIAGALSDYFGRKLVLVFLQSPNFGRLMEQTMRLLNPVKLFSLSDTTRSTKDKKSLRHLAIFWFGYLCVYCGIEYTLIFLARARFNFTSADQGKMFGFIGLLMMLVQGFFIRRFKLGGEDKAITWSTCCLILASGILGFATNIFIFYIGLTLYAFASSIFFPSVNGLVSLHTTAQQQGQTLGIFRSLNALARVLGAVFVTTVFWIYGPSITYMLCTIFLSLLLMYRKITQCQSEQTYKEK